MQICSASSIHQVEPSQNSCSVAKICFVATAAATALTCLTLAYMGHCGYHPFKALNWNQKVSLACLGGVLAFIDTGVVVMRPRETALTLLQPTIAYGLDTGEAVERLNNAPMGKVLVFMKKDNKSVNVAWKDNKDGVSILTKIPENTAPQGNLYYTLKENNGTLHQPQLWVADSDGNAHKPTLQELSNLIKQ